MIHQGRLAAADRTREKIETASLNFLAQLRQLLKPKAQLPVFIMKESDDQTFKTTVIPN